MRLSIQKNDQSVTPRRAFINRGLRGLVALALGGLFGVAWSKTKAVNRVWQLDPHQCVQCGRCADLCVLKPSAVKCVHEYAMCGFCQLCFGYFRSGAARTTSDAENQICPTGAIKRTFIEDPYFEYVIDEELCFGCGKCVKGCNDFGNGSLYLQVRHDRCLNCNDCAIARQCPAGAFRRVPADQPYIMKGEIS